MNIFIDTNIFLAFYHFANDDLVELNKLIILLKQRKVVLWLPQQVVSEFERNRETKISDALKKLGEQKLTSQFPLFCKAYEEYDELRVFQKEYDKKFTALRNRINQDVADKKLKADEIINTLFGLAEVLATGEEIVNLARLRSDIGNPPGKNNSLGDAINWESLLSKFPENNGIHIIADDKDYYSVIDKQSGNPFLRAEWRGAKHADIDFYRSLSAFFKKHFPDIKFPDDLEQQLDLYTLEAYLRERFSNRPFLLRECDLSQVLHVLIRGGLGLKALDSILNRQEALIRSIESVPGQMNVYGVLKYSLFAGLPSNTYHEPGFFGGGSAQQSLRQQIQKYRDNLPPQNIEE